MNQGALLAIFASLIFSVMNALVKTIADDIPTGEIVFFRSSIGCLLVLLLMYRHGVAFSREDRPLLVLRGTMGGLYLICYFTASPTSRWPTPACWPTCRRFLHSAFLAGAA